MNYYKINKLYIYHEIKEWNPVSQPKRSSMSPISTIACQKSNQHPNYYSNHFVGFLSGFINQVCLPRQYSLVFSLAHFKNFISFKPLLIYNLQDFSSIPSFYISSVKEPRICVPESAPSLHSLCNSTHSSVPAFAHWGLDQTQA